MIGDDKIVEAGLRANMLSDGTSRTQQDASFMGRGQPTAPAQGGWEKFGQYAKSIPGRIGTALPYAIAAGRTGDPAYMLQAGQAARQQVQDAQMMRELQGIDPTASPQEMQRALSIFMKYGRKDMASMLLTRMQDMSVNQFKRNELAQDESQFQRELAAEGREFVDIGPLKDLATMYNAPGGGGARFKYIAEKFSSLKTAANHALEERNAAAYMAVINGFIKMIDEGVVRTSEYETAESLQSWRMQIEGFLNRAGEGFNEGVLNNISRIADDLMDEAVVLQAPQYDAFVRQISRYGDYTEDDINLAVYNPHRFKRGGEHRSRYETVIDLD